MKTLNETHLPMNLVGRGKVRDIYEGPSDSLVVVTTDRISAYDVVLNQQVPGKGQGLNLSSASSFVLSGDIVDNHVIGIPHSNVMVVHRAEPYPVEVIVRGYLSGSAWRNYSAGRRRFFDTTLPDGLRRNQKLDRPLHTPTTKANVGHDADITPEESVSLVGGAAAWSKIRDVATALYVRANEITASHDYAMGDTKYEFGSYLGRLLLIDEANTHDSSRFFRLDTYPERFERGEDLAWIDKEYVRIWLREHDFTGDGPVPDLPEEVLQGASERVAESVFALTGVKFRPTDPDEQGIIDALRKYGYVRD